MKKNFYFLLSMMLTCSMVSAQEVSDTIEIEKADKVVVKSNSKSMSVEVFGKEGDPDYHLSKALELDGEGVNVSKETNSNYDFVLPFTKSSKENHGTIQVTMAPTLSVGLVSGLGGPGNLDIDFGKSVEITWHAFHAILKLKDSPWQFSTGLWFNWKNYRMTGDTRFDKEGSNVVMMPYPEGSDPKFSRVHTLSYQFPFLVHYKTKNFKFAAGTLLNINGHGSLKTRYYDAEGQKHKDRDRNVHLNSFTADILGIVSFRNFVGAYVKYSPCNVLDTRYGPKFHGLSTGLIFNW